MQKEDIALAARLAEESMVLLKNEKNLLPLSSTVKRVALIGPMVKDRSDLLGAWLLKVRPKMWRPFMKECRKNLVIKCGWIMSRVVHWVEMMNRVSPLP